MAKVLIIIEQQPVDEIVTRISAQQGAPAGKDCHPPDNQGKDRGDLVQGDFHILLLCVEPEGCDWFEHTLVMLAGQRLKSEMQQVDV